MHFLADKKVGMKEKIEVEQKFLNDTEQLLQKLLDKHFSSGRSSLDAFSRHRTIELVRRMVNQEVEYLHEDPENYFDIYGGEYKDN